MKLLAKVCSISPLLWLSNSAIRAYCDYPIIRAWSPVFTFFAIFPIVALIVSREDPRNEH